MKFLSLAELCECRYAHTDSPVLAHARPVALRLEAMFCGSSQGPTGGSHGGGGLLEVGGTIQGASSLVTREMNKRKRL